MTSDGNGLTILSRPECLELLGTRPIGRVAVTSGALPAIYPVTYTIRGETVLFAVGDEPSSLAPLSDAVIAFEADDVDLDTRRGWSVMVIGLACRLELSDETAETRRALEVALRPWAGPRATHLIRLATAHISGRRLSGHLATVE